MKLAFFVNQVVTEIDEYTTTRLALAAARTGHEVWYVGAGDVGYASDEKIRARAPRAEFRADDTRSSFLTRLQEAEPSELVLDDLDALVIRNDSIEDLHDRTWAATAGVVFGQILATRGVTVLNDPTTLSRAVSKLYLQEFPAEIRPECIVTRAESEVKEFVAEYGSTIVKPLYGAKGRNVFMIQGTDDPNLSQMVETILEDGFVVAQGFVSNKDGSDIRLFLVDGEPLQIEGTYAAFRRVPRTSDVRANISSGAKPVKTSIGKVELGIAEAVKDKLAADGMFFVGLDIIDDKVVEINGESPGGLQSANHLTGIDFAPPIIDGLEKRVDSSGG